MKAYNHNEVEKKWQNIWEKQNTYDVKNHQQGKDNAYILVEFPYPSGKGLHVGHIRSYSALDCVARKLRLQGKNVLFPIGCDAFGLEAERTAIKEKKLPQEIVKRNIQTFIEQLKDVGLSFSWDRFINTSDPDYYKWTQWLFLKFFEKGLAYKDEVMVNFCANCGVLANEEVENGKCCQCKSDVIQKPKSQWILKMTQYADRLDKDLDKVNFLPHIKTSQKNWIGKSEGVEIKFDLECGGNFKVFTTCVETVFGITHFVFAPENPLVKQLQPKIQNWNEVQEYIKTASKKSEFERKEMLKEKTGCILKGIYAINPLNNKKVPVYIGDYVLANYGTGAVMSVPAHDDRDKEFADRYGIEYIEVISGGDVSKKAFAKEEYLGIGAKLVNSGKYNGLTVEQAKNAIYEDLHKLGLADKKLNFKMRDWVFSRQRYWGEPIPVVHCKHCGTVAVPENELPITLPQVDSYEPTKDGESPLAAIESWVNTTCPKCGAPAKRETDTMPGWAGSSWYFMRYCDAHNNQEFASKDALNAWLPVDLYNGGNEHTTRHLLYARFWVKALYDMGIVSVDEPFMSRFSQGIILGANGIKMSKSLGNVVDPRDVINEYGADALRMWELFIGDYQECANWNDNGTVACFKTLNRIWNMQEFLVDGEKESEQLKTILHQTIKKVTEDIDNIKFNTAVSQIMIFINEVYKNKKINKFEYKTLLTLVSPIAPHICNELFELCGFGSLENALWPKYNEAYLVQTEVEIPIQINGKLRGTILVNKQATEQEVLCEVKAKDILPNDANIKKVVYVPARICNIILQ